METRPLTEEYLIDCSYNLKSDSKTPIMPTRETDPNNSRDGWKFISLTDLGDGRIENVWDTGQRMIVETRLNGQMVRMHIQDKIENPPRQKLVVPWRD